MLVKFSNHIPHLVVGTLLLPDRESAKIHSNQANPIIRGPNQSLTSPTGMHNSLPLLNPNYSIGNVHPSEPTSSAGACPFQRQQRGRPQISTRKRTKVYEWDPASCSITPVYATTHEASGNCCRVSSYESSFYKVNARPGTGPERDTGLARKGPKMRQIESRNRRNRTRPSIAVP